MQPRQMAVRWAQLALGWVEPVNKHLVQTQVGDDREAASSIEIDRVSVRSLLPRLRVGPRILGAG